MSSYQEHALDGASAVDLVVARAGTEPFSREEVGLLRAAARRQLRDLHIVQRDERRWLPPRQ